jgi:hypothetical protein
VNLFQQSIKNLTGSFCCKYFGDDAYDNIVEWYIDNPPTKAEVEAEWSRLKAEQPRKEAEANRAAAYAAEADPLFFKAQRGEATTDEWTAKVAEIKARFPYPGGEE